MTAFLSMIFEFDGDDKERSRFTREGSMEVAAGYWCSIYQPFLKTCQIIPRTKDTKGHRDRRDQEKDGNPKVLSVQCETRVN